MNIEARDLAIVLATLIGPFLAVYVSDLQRKKADARNRKVHIFRKLMATRSATLVGSHIEALNLVQVEFEGSRRKDRAVMDCWSLYLSHLNNHSYPRDVWGARREDLMVDLLFEMSKCLGYSYAKASIKASTYYPQGYSDAEADNFETRKLWLEILRGHKSLPMRVEMPPPQPQPQPQIDKP